MAASRAKRVAAKRWLQAEITRRLSKYEGEIATPELIEKIRREAIEALKDSKEWVDGLLKE